jgi:hypothetical protein
MLSRTIAENLLYLRVQPLFIYSGGTCIFLLFHTLPTGLIEPAFLEEAIMFHQLHHLSFSLIYLDPGSGSMLIQLLAATVVGGLFLLRMMWGKITTAFKQKSSAQVETNDLEHPDDN